MVKKNIVYQLFKVESQPTEKDSHLSVHSNNLKIRWEQAHSVYSNNLIKIHP
jgi:hypothetical protein